MSRNIFEEHHILNLGVFPPRQKEGISAKLLRSFLKSTKNSLPVFLEAKKSNFPAIEIYKSNGFKVFGDRRNYYKEGSSALMMNCRKVY